MEIGKKLIYLCAFLDEFSFRDKTPNPEQECPRRALASAEECSLSMHLNFRKSFQNAIF